MRFYVKSDYRHTIAISRIINKKVLKQRSYSCVSARFPAHLQNWSLTLSDAISESSPRVVDDNRARKLSNELRRCSYYETCATYGLNVERVFQDGKTRFLYYDVTSPCRSLGNNSSRNAVTVYLHVTLMEISLQNRFYLHFSVVCRWSFIRMFPLDNSGASARKLHISTNKTS